jgi:diaminohydroxyphosphoribosylaminopyrimidine deaminase/5-amino-6-(5-phosphoribosylamino)uracil reductase
MMDASDSAFMARALFLAERGRGRTTPNPIVGAIVVSSEGVIVGQGAHLAAGGPHAEVVALEAAGASAHGATLYCTLEPCRHRGRTGPCVERIAAAGIRRVVVAARDPNPVMNGAGLADLASRGVEVVEGIEREAAVLQNAFFRTWVRRRRPFVILKTAVSLDGFVGGPGGRVKLTGALADRFLHRQRAEVDAIGVGSETVLVDDPLLTARGAYRFRPLVRLIFDWRFRVPPAARLFSTLDAGPVIMVVSSEAAAADRAKVDELARRGVIVERYECRDLAAVLENLAGRDVLSLIVEGGPTLQTAFWEAGLVDRLQRVTTARALGSGVRAARVFREPPPCEMPRSIVLGNDVLVECDVHGLD